MIYIDRIITILNNQATIEQPIVLYKGDKNVQLLFTLKDNYLKYKSMENAYGQLIIKRPTANPIFSEVARLSSSKVTFIVTQEMIDELSEVGNYEFQIRLFSQDKSSRATLPPISEGIIIREPILEEDTPNEVGIATVNETQVMAEDIELEVFDEEGKYNKTNWQNGDIISDVKLNKIEQAIYEINEKEVEVDLSTLATKEELNEYATKEELNEGLETKSDLEHTHEEYAPIDYPKFTSASSRTLTVGQYNEKDVLGDYIFIAGNGTEYSKKTVYKLSKEGHGYYEKGVTIGQPPTTNNEVTNKSYVDSGLNKKADKDHTHNYLTEKDISGKADKTDLHEHTNKTVLDGITQEKVREWNNKSDFSGNYDNLSNKPYIPSIEGLATETYVDEKVGEIIVPTKVSELENDSNFVTQTYVSDAINKAQFEGNDSIDLSIYAKLEDLHEHENKTVLDGITEEKVTEWDNKAELNNPTFTGDVKIQEDENNNYNCSLAVGEFAEANRSSLAVGSGTATGEYSVAFGCNVITNRYNQFVHGLCNIEDTEYSSDSHGVGVGLGKYAEIVGNGHYDNELGEVIPSNAYTLDWYGNGWYQGKLTIEGTPTEEKDVTTKLYVDTLVSELATKEEIPTKVSQLENDSNYLIEVPSEYITESELEDKGYLTEHQDLSDYITETELNNKGYLTEHQDISHLALKTELHEHENKTILDTITEETINTWNNKSEFDGDYNSLTNQPTIPSIEGLASEEYVDEKIANIEIKDNLETVVVESNLLALTTNKYQYVEISGDTEIVLPTVDTFKEIHLFFKLESDFANTIELSANEEIICQAELEFEGDYSYEIIATFIPNIGWLVGQVRYGEKLPCGLCSELECTCTSLKATDVEVDFAIAMKYQGEAFSEYSTTMESNGYTFKQITVSKTTGGWRNLTNKLEELGYVEGVGYATYSTSAGTTWWYAICWNVTLYGEPNITLLDQLTRLSDTQLEQVKTYGKYN